MLYNSNELNTKLMTAIRSRYPNFRTWRIILSGPSGSGKSTAAASFPIEDGKQRIVLDHEDSMSFIDAGEDGIDVYTPNKQRFRMKRLVFPTLAEYANIHQVIEKGNSNIGALIIDNVAIFQANIINMLTVYSANPGQLREVYKKFGISHLLPSDRSIQKWGEQKDPSFWDRAKELPRSIIMNAMKNNVHIIVTTEEANVWENYGSPGAKVIGRKAKIWDVWYKYFDMVIMLNRDINTRKPPTGNINPLQPKMRLQGFNPKWTMDWEGFTNELVSSLDRNEPEIPEESKVQIKQTYEEEPE